MDLLEAHKHFPKSSSLHIEASEQNFQYLEILYFEELETLNFFGPPVELTRFTKFLKSLKENKLRKIIFPDFIVQEEEEILQFYETLFDKTNLEEFHKKFSFDCSFERKKGDCESKLLSSWIGSNVNLKKLSLGKL
jgi:hypothetical protein